jgi:glyoxylase-like metal-dependent hydrolase (beta-lactamase superfamily II)
METNRVSKFFSPQRIAPQTTVIAGLGMELCYLLEGSERALLIDALSGAGNLRAFCRELTDLPITLVNTHGHVDHAGGNFDFGECYIHPNDIALVYESCRSKERRGFVEKMLKAAHREVPLSGDDFTELGPIKTLPVKEGDVFDLGGRTIEVFSLAGHTTGSIVLLDRKEGILFSGDACNVNTLVCLPHSTSIEEYRENLLRFKEQQPFFTVMYGGHGLFGFPNTLLDEAIDLCGEIMDRRDDAVPGDFLGLPCFYGKQKDQTFKRLDGKTANIAYRADAIFRPR